MSGIRFKYIIEGPDKVRVVAEGREEYAKAFQTLRAKFPKGVLRIRAEMIKEQEGRTTWTNW